MDLRVLAALSVAGWALLVSAWRWFDGWKHRTRRARRRVVAARGTVLTETLIIFPVFLLLTFGLAQFILNCTAGLLANLAVFQAGRTAFLWHQEVDADEVDARAKIAAATVMTPVSPSGIQVGCPFGIDQPYYGAKSTAFAEMVGMPSDSGQSLAAGKARGNRGEDLSFITPLGTESFAERTVVKFYQSNCLTDVTTDGTKVELTYRHRQLMPLVGGIFGDQFSTNEYYSELERTFEGLPSQVRPNYTPPANFFAIINSLNPFTGGMTDVAQGTNPLG
jgi:hypothetical protein